MYLGMLTSALRMLEVTGLDDLAEKRVEGVFSSKSSGRNVLLGTNLIKLTV
jgi:hypothetical protein